MSDRLQKKFILLLGNPGAGKSTIHNSLMGSVQFRSGVSMGSGLTTALEKMTIGDTTYIDTPGLSDVRLRSKAAEAIVHALQQNGHYRVCFVVTLFAGRVRPEDVDTIKAILLSAPIHSFGIIVNKVSSAMMKRLDDSRFMEGVCAAIVEDLPVKTDRFLFIPTVPELEDADNKLWDCPKELRNFVDELPGMSIQAGMVKMHVSLQQEREERIRALEAKKREDELRLQQQKKAEEEQRRRQQEEARRREWQLQQERERARREAEQREHQRRMLEEQREREREQAREREREQERLRQERDRAEREAQRRQEQERQMVIQFAHPMMMHPMMMHPMAMRGFGYGGPFIHFG